MTPDVDRIPAQSRGLLVEEAGRRVHLLPIVVVTGRFSYRVAIVRVFLDPDGQPESLAIGTEGCVEIVPG
jgi:hypothetical protein